MCRCPVLTDGPMATPLRPRSVTVCVRCQCVRTQIQRRTVTVSVTVGRSPRTPVPRPPSRTLPAMAPEQHQSIKDATNGITIREGAWTLCVHVYASTRFCMYAFGVSVPVR